MLRDARQRVRHHPSCESSSLVTGEQVKQRMKKNCSSSNEHGWTRESPPGKCEVLGVAGDEIAIGRRNPRALDTLIPRLLREFLAENMTEMGSAYETHRRWLALQRVGGKEKSHQIRLCHRLDVFAPDDVDSRASQQLE